MVFYFWGEENGDGVDDLKKSKGSLFFDIFIPFFLNWQFCLQPIFLNGESNYSYKSNTFIGTLYLSIIEGVLDFDSGKVNVICFLIIVFILVLIKNSYNLILIYYNKNINEQ